MAFRILAVVGLAVIPFAAAELLTLTPDNFDQAISTNKKILVEFYAPWCGYCQQFEPKYKELAKKVAADPELKDVVIAKIDGDANTELSEKMKIQGFPTLMLFKGDPNAETYNGDLEIDNVLNFLKTGENPEPPNYDDENQDQEQHHEGQEEHPDGEEPPYEQEQQVEVNIQNLTTVDEINKLIKNASDAIPVAIAFIPQSNAEAFKEAAYYSPSIQYAQVFDEKTAKGFGAEFGSLHIFKVTNDVPETPAIYKDAFTGEEVKNWITANRFPVVGRMTMDNLYDYWGEDEHQQLAYLAISGKDVAAKKKAIEIMKVQAAKYPKIRCFYIDTDTELYSQLKDELAMGSSKVLLTVGYADQYLYDGALEDSAKLSKFFADFDAKKLERRLKSEEIPDKNDAPVYVLVGKTFPQAIGKEKDVFVEFYAPWCGHCQELAPKYEKVGSVFEDVKDLVVAKMDATVNEVPQQVQAYPTLLFYQAGKTEPIEYQGEREAKDIVEWLKDKATVDISAMKGEL